MVVVENGQLNKEFLDCSAVQNARALLKVLRPQAAIRSRSTEGLIDQLGSDGLTVEPGKFVEAMWSLMQFEAGGAYHLSLSSLTPFVEADGLGALEDAVARWHAVGERRQVIETESILDARWVEGRKHAEVLYMGRAEALFYDEDQSYSEDIAGVPYEFRAYKRLEVPVLSRMDLGPDLPYACITTRAIHQGVETVAESGSLRSVLEESLDIPFPALGGIADGIRALWGTTITPRRIDASEPDGSRVNMACAPGTKNPSSEELEAILRDWTFRKGSLVCGRVPFKVDVARAVFSFGTRVTRQNAIDVISTILGAG